MEITVLWARGCADPAVGHVHEVFDDAYPRFMARTRSFEGLCGAWLGERPVSAPPDDCEAACATCIELAREAFDPGPVCTVVR